MKKKLKDAGYSGSDYYLAAHSLGTVVTQLYSVHHASEYKGQILMGGSILKSEREEDQSTGQTILKNKIPTLVLGAERDGLYRITREAEAYYHHVVNINPSQAGKYPV